MSGPLWVLPPQLKSFRSSSRFLMLRAERSPRIGPLEGLPPGGGRLLCLLLRLLPGDRGAAAAQRFGSARGAVRWGGALLLRAALKEVRSQQRHLG